MIFVLLLLTDIFCDFSPCGPFSLGNKVLLISGLSDDDEEDDDDEEEDDTPQGQAAPAATASDDDEEDDDDDDYLDRLFDDILGGE